MMAGRGIKRSHSRTRSQSPTAMLKAVEELADQINELNLEKDEDKGNDIHQVINEYLVGEFFKMDVNAKKPRGFANAKRSRRFRNKRCAFIPLVINEKVRGCHSFSLFLDNSYTAFIENNVPVNELENIFNYTACLFNIQQDNILQIKEICDGALSSIYVVVLTDRRLLNRTEEYNWIHVMASPEGLRKFRFNIKIYEDQYISLSNILDEFFSMDDEDEDLEVDIDEGGIKDIEDNLGN